MLSTIPEQIDIEEVEEDASGLLPCPVDGWVCTYQFQESGTVRSYSLKLNHFQIGSLFAEIGVVIT